MGNVSITKECDVVVVGAGLSGLQTATLLKEQGLSVLVLEARDRVGGRLLSHTLKNGARVDLGGQWLGATHHRAHKIVKSLGEELFPTYNKGKNVFMMTGEKQVRDSFFPEMDDDIAEEIERAMARLNELAFEIDTTKPWAKEEHRAYDKITYADWIRQNTTSDIARNAMTFIAMSIFSAEAHELSMLHVLFYVASGEGVDTLISTEDGAQELRFTNGAQQLPIGLAKRLGDDVLLNQPVTCIEHFNHHVIVSTHSLQVNAKRVVVALPPALAGRLSYKPALPGIRDQLTQRTAMGAVIKVIVTFDKPFWRDEELSGLASSTTLPLSLTYDNSPQDGSCGILVGFMEADEGRYWGTKTAQEREQKVIECLRDYFGSQVDRYTEYKELDWAQEEYSRGAYGGYLPPGAWSIFGEAVSQPINSIHFAGTETASQWAGYMEGALQSAERVAQEILEVLNVKHRHQAVN